MSVRQALSAECFPIPIVRHVIRMDFRSSTVWNTRTVPQARITTRSPDVNDVNLGRDGQLKGQIEMF